ncbi:MAG: radical SAM family heme chaperone HemW [Cellvibrionales bacterium]|nr:radical SAM family heme chaperone HemW [Cellvibrionales bacterium]
MFALLPPLSLYVHLPWCGKKCPYCDFNSHAARASDIPEAAYLQALERDLRQNLHAVQGRRLGSIFFGGGTPSLFSAAAIGRIIGLARRHIGLVDDAEITLEANPDSADAARFAGYRRAGVNRLSIGVQSFADRRLVALGRLHSAAQARRAYHLARRAGFDNINLDLMFGLPGQDLAGVRADLEQAIALRPEHLSWYELTIEPNTAFYRVPPARADADALADMAEMGLALLAEHGFQRYETSAFAVAGRQCRHNLNYWRFGDYLGIGAGAQGKHSERVSGAIIRQAKTRHPQHYMDRIGSYVAHRQRVSGRELLGDYMLGALRLIDGVPLRDAAMHTRLSPAALLQACQPAMERGLLKVAGEQLRPTEPGTRLLNLCLQTFL